MNLTRTQGSLQMMQRCEDFLDALDVLPELTNVVTRGDARLGRVADDHYILLAFDAESPAVDHAWVVPALPNAGTGWFCTLEDIGTVQVTHFFAPDGPR